MRQGAQRGQNDLLTLLINFTVFPGGRGAASRCAQTALCESLNASLMGSAEDMNMSVEILTRPGHCYIQKVAGSWKLDWS